MSGQNKGLMENINVGFTASVDMQKANADNRSMVEVAESRAMHEVQAAYVIAKKFPRDELACFNKIMKACKRQSLAEQSMYAYPRGGTVVTGPSIRLAEAMAQAWGNIDFGIREVSQSNGVSVVETYAIDLESNTPSRKVFTVKHERHTKKGVTRLTDPRDIYELIANQAARRLRNCILSILPGDVVESAVAQTRKTLESSDVPLDQQIRKMVVAFDEIGVKIEHLEKRLGHNLDATIVTEIVTLKSIYKSIKDGAAKREDFFEIAGAEKKADAEAVLNNLLGEKEKPNGKDKK